MFNKIKINIKKYLLSGYGKNDRIFWNLAIETYKKSLVIHPNAFIIWIQLGNSARDSGLYDEASAAYAKAMSINNKNSDLFMQMGRLEKKRGNLKGELVNYLNAKAANSTNDEIEQELRKFKLDTLRKLFTGRTKNTNSTMEIQSFKGIESAKYTSAFKDVKLYIELGIIANAEQHYNHYGYKQGRDVLASLQESPPEKAIILCPSMGKRCGIGEHSRYIALSLEKNGIKVIKVRTTQQLLELDSNILHNSIVIVNHGPGLFDGFIAEMSEGEPTVRLMSNLRYAFDQFGARPVVLTHTLFDGDNKEYKEFVSRQQMMMEMPVPKVTTIIDAARVFNIAHVEHGMQPLTKHYDRSTTERNIDRPTVGFFGFLGLGGKNYDALFTTLQRIKGKLVGSVVTNNQDLPQLRKMLEERAIEEDLGTGWIEDDELAERLSVADFHYLPHYDYDFWNNSGTARFAMNFGRPVITPPHIPFLDLKDYAILADENDLPAMLSHLRTSKAYTDASKRVIQYAENKPMTKEMVSLAFDLPEIQAQISSDLISRLELNCLSELLQCNAQNFEARMKHFYNVDFEIQSTEKLSNERRNQILNIAKSHPEITNFDFSPLPQIIYWREHYELRNLYRNNAYECFVHVIRSLLKREPGLPDEVLVRQLLNIDLSNSSATISPQDFIQLVAGILGLDRAIQFSRPIQIYLDFEPIQREKLFEPSILDRLTLDLETMLNYLPDFNSNPTQSFGHINDFNICACLLLPPKISASRISQAIGLNNEIELAIESIMNQDVDIYRRFMAINNLIREENKDLLETMLLDWPIIGDSLMSRNEYYVNEFALFTGKEFILKAYRSLLKRDPTAFEQIKMVTIMGRRGRIQVLRDVSQSATACACIIDIDKYDDSDLDQSANLTRPLIERFRSPIAGGWDLRNRYLVERRNASRSLLRMDRLCDDDYGRYGYSALTDRQLMTNAA